MTLSAHLTPDLWIEQLFSSRAAAKGGVVRRKQRDIERLVGLTRFKHEITRRGYTALTNAGDIIVFCNQDPIEPL